MPLSPFSKSSSAISLPKPPGAMSIPSHPRSSSVDVTFGTSLKADQLANSRSEEILTHPHNCYGWLTVPEYSGRAFNTLYAHRYTPLAPRTLDALEVPPLLVPLPGPLALTPSPGVARLPFLDNPAAFSVTWAQNPDGYLEGAQR